MKRRLGRSSLEITPLVLGGNVFGWSASREASFAVLDRFVALGGNCIDTADVYSRWAPGNQGGESESILGEWMSLRGNRSQVILATKCGMEMGPGKKGLSKGYIVEAVEASLKRLRSDYIDLYQAHTDDTETPLEESLAAFDSLVRAGKVRAVGASNYTAERLDAALLVSERLGLARYDVLQPWYNLYDRDKFEGELERLCVTREIGVIPYYSLASGFLTGKYRQKSDLKKSVRGGNIEKYLTDRGAKILDVLDEASNRHHCSMAAVALAWLMARPSVTAPIASATSPAQIDELMKSLEVQLSADELVALDRASAG